MFHRPEDAPVQAPDCNETDEKQGEVFVEHLGPGEYHRFFVLSGYKYGFSNNHAKENVPGAHCPPEEDFIPYRKYSWNHDRFTRGTSVGIGTKHSYSQKDEVWYLPNFRAKYGTQSTYCIWYVNSEFPPDASEEGEITCDFEDL